MLFSICVPGSGAQVTQPSSSSALQASRYRLDSDHGQTLRSPSGSLCLGASFSVPCQASPFCLRFFSIAVTKQHDQGS